MIGDSGSGLFMVNNELGQRAAPGDNGNQGDNQEGE